MWVWLGVHRHVCYFQVIQRSISTSLEISLSLQLGSYASKALCPFIVAQIGLLKGLELGGQEPCFGAGHAG